MFENRKQQKVQKELNKKFKEWVTKGTGTAPVYMGMSNKEFADWQVYGIIPERFL